MPWKDKYTSIGLSVFVEVEDEEEDVLVFEDDSEKSEKEDNDTPPLFQDEPVINQIFKLILSSSC